MFFILVVAIFTPASLLLGVLLAGLVALLTLNRGPRSELIFGAALLPPISLFWMVVSVLVLSKFDDIAAENDFGLNGWKTCRLPNGLRLRIDEPGGSGRLFKRHGFGEIRWRIVRVQMRGTYLMAEEAGRGNAASTYFCLNADTDAIKDFST